MDPMLPTTKRLLSLLALTCMAGALYAQCSFDPTITPSAPILCPNAAEALSTQVYDAYQWFKDGSPIPGADGQVHLVDAFQDAGCQFHVEATLDGCTESSPQVLVDGWAFLPPTVMTAGDPIIGITPGNTIYCQGDTALLIMMLPYDTNIQWTDQNVPIQGATDDTLVVTSTGQYSASGAPSICPGFMQPLGVQIGMLFLEPIQPDVVPNGSELCAYPTGESYQWYHDGEPLADSNAPCIEATMGGAYVVEVIYDPDCYIPSEPFIITGVSSQDVAPWRVYPQPAKDQVTLEWGDGSELDAWRLMDATGRVVMEAQGPTRSPLSMDVRSLDSGRYWLQVPGRAAARITVMH